MKPAYFIICFSFNNNFRFSIKGYSRAQQVIKLKYVKYTCSMETVQQNGRFTLFSSKFLSIYSILYGQCTACLPIRIQQCTACLPSRIQQCTACLPSRIWQCTAMFTYLDLVEYYVLTQDLVVYCNVYLVGSGSVRMYSYQDLIVF